MVRPYSPIRRMIAIMSAFAVLAQSGCASNQPPPGTRAELSYGFYETNGQPVSLREFAIDGSARGAYKEYLAPGSHKVTVGLEWSNEWEDRTVLDVELAAERRYVILVYELAPGQAPENVVLKPPSDASVPEIAGGALARGAVKGALPLIILTAPIWWPIWRVFHATTPVPTRRPFENCCFVWIQDASSGAIVAGTSPPGARK